jgi:two-component system, NarL family, sensor histidine kinase UhpB
VHGVALPHYWALSRPAGGDPQWYRIVFQPFGTLERGDLLALYIERVCSNLEVQLNGQLVHSGGRMGSSVTNNCAHPQLVALPSALIGSGQNQLDILVVGHPLAEVASRQRSGALSTLIIGPQSELATRHARRMALQVTAPQAVSATLLLMGSFMFVLGFINRSESHLAYFGAMSVGWAIVDARSWLRTLPFIAWAAVQFLLRYAGVRDRRVDVLMPLQCGLITLSLLIAGPQRLHAVAVAWYALLALEVAAAAAWHLHRTRLTRSVWPMAVLMVAVTGAAAVEFAAQWTGVRPLAVNIAQLVLPVAFVLVGLRLVQQHGRALVQSQQDRRQLEQRVREATAEIERNFHQLSELRVEQVTERERKRIAADLHDDLGAKLLTIVHTSDSERISTLAREALEEMRLSVRGLTGKAVRLSDALGDWRAEVVSRLSQAGIEGEWEAPEDLPQRLSARAYVQTTRILREATSNIIKHSGATHCSVRAAIADGDFQLVVQDDGDGISPDVDARLDRGHGLASMKHRAKQLQGQCLVESGPGYGTVIRLTVPLDRATEPS